MHRASDTQTDETLETLSCMVLDTHIYNITSETHSNTLHLIHRQIWHLTPEDIKPLAGKASDT